jgi:fructose-bisphosphate aldolase class 1
MLTLLDAKLAEAHALAIAADVVTAKVLERTTDSELRYALRELARDAGETRARCVELEQRYDDETATELLHEVNHTKDKANELAASWFKAGTDTLEAWTFLAMGEAAEVATWSALTALAVQADDEEVCALGAWALDLQERHLRVALACSVRLAEAANPAAQPL